MSKKKINSRTKGQSFERKVASMLNNKFDTDAFSRTPGSGAFATTHKLPEHLQIHGDLITLPGFKYVVECKSGYEVVDLPALLRRTSPLYDWIKQAKRDAKASNRKPLLIVQHTRRQAYCLVDLSYTQEEHIASNSEHPIFITIEGLDLISLDDFLSLPNNTLLV